MATFKLDKVNNGIDSARRDNHIGFKLVSDETSNWVQFSEVVIDLSGFDNNIDWNDDGIVAEMDGFTPEFVGQSLRFISRRMRTFQGAEYEFSISGIELKNKAVSGTIGISFVLRRTTTQLSEHTYIGGEVIISKETPVVNIFKLEPSIIKEKANLNLYFECSNVDSYDITYGNGIGVNDELPELMDKHCEGVLNVTSLYNESGNIASFHIVAKAGNIQASKNCIKQVVIAKDGWTRTIPNDDSTGKAQTSKILDIVTNISNNDEMYAFARGSDRKVLLWKTNDGLLWEKHKIGDEERHIPANFVHCPAVYYRGDIYIIGGSKVDVGSCSADIHVLELDTTRPVYKHTKNVPFEPRSLHSCVVYNNEIWVMGGVNENGNGLNDVWRFNGDWINVATPANFPRRCMFAATTHHDKHSNNSIWIGGGYDSYEGNALKDMWVYNSGNGVNAWTPVQNIRSEGQRNVARQLDINDDMLKATALVSLKSVKGNNNKLIIADTFDRDPDNTVVTRLRTINESSSQPVDRVQVIPYSFSSINGEGPNLDNVLQHKFILSSIAFNGCVWMMAVAYKGAGTTDSDSLFYKCI